MPCKIQITEFLTNQIESEVSPLRARDPFTAKKEVARINRNYSYNVAEVSQWDADLFEINVNIPQTMVDEYFENEKKKEIEEARAIQRADALRAGVDYSDNYLFDNIATALPIVEEAEYDDYEKVLNDLKNERSLSLARALADRYSKAYNIPYEVLSPAQARQILRQTDTSYRGQASFYYGNKVYIIEGNFNPDSVLHEFAHPFIQALEQDNNKLFNNLYNSLSTMGLGQEIIELVKAKYPELADDESRFKQEVLVTALERKSLDKLKDIEKNDPEFEDFISRLLYAIKQIIRKLIPKADLKSLKANTTFDQLVDMFNDPTFVVEVPKFTEDDFVYFKKTMGDFVTQLKSVENDTLVKMINRAYQEAVYEINAIKAAPFRLTKELSGKDGIKILRAVRDQLKNYQTAIADPSSANPIEVADAILEHNTEFNKRALALITTMNDIETFAENVNKVLGEMESRNEHFKAEGISKIMYFKDLALRQKEFIRDMKKVSTLKKTNEFYKKLNSIENTLDDTLNSIKELQLDFVKDFFQSETSIMNTNLNEELKTRITQIFKVNKLSDDKINDFYEKVINTPDGKKLTIKDIEYNINPKQGQRLIDAVNEYFVKRLNKEQISDFIEGKRDDLDFFSAWLVPYSNIDDPLVGSFTRFMKKMLKTAQNKSLRQANEYSKTLFPLLKEVGYNPNSTSQLADMLLFIDKVGTINDKGEYEEFEVRSFIDKFKNWRFERGKLQNAFDDARESKDEAKMRETYEALVDFDEKYMHRKYKKEYYDLQKIWKEGAIVKNPFTKEEIRISKEEAFQSWLERQSALDKLNVLRHMHFTELEDVQEFTMADAANAEYQQLFDIYNPDNTPKTGEELRKTLLRRLYRKESRKFYEYPTDEIRVQQDLNAFVDKLEAIGISYDTDREAFDKELKKFEKRNFRVAYTDEYFKEKRRILDEIKKINSKAKANKDVLDKREDLSRQLFELVNQVRDKNGQPNGIEFTQEQLKRIKALEEEITEIDELYDKNSGLLYEDKVKLKRYEDRLANDEELSPEEEVHYQSLLGSENNFGLTKLEKDMLNKLWADYRELTEKIPTQYYIEAFEYALGGIEVEPIDIINADDWINGQNLTKAFAENPNFKEWFLKNHYLKEVYDPVVGERVPKFIRTAAWSVSIPTSDKSYKKTTLEHPVTKEPIIIRGVPSGKYSYQKIKDEYMTIPKGANKEDYIGKVIDNMGNFLPRDYVPGDPNSAYNKDFINEKYEQMDKSSPQFKLLEAIKKIYLDIQKNSTNSTRLYLDLARMRPKSNLEVIQSGQGRETLKEKLDSVWSVTKAMVGRGEKPADAEEFGLNADTSLYLLPTNMQGQPVNRIPVKGLYKLKVNETSTDVLGVLYEYLESVNEHRTLLENEPMVNAIKDVLNDPDNAIKNMNAASKQVKKATGKLQFLPKGSGNTRADTLNYLADKILYGKKNDTLTEDYPGIAQFANTLMRRASRAFIALDVPSALKNRFGMIFQSIIETSAGKYLTATSLAQGRAKAFTSMIELSSKGIYQRGPKSLDLQMMEYFDPITGKTKKDFGKSSSRTFMKDMLDFSFLYDFRKYAEVEAGLQVYWGMMYNKKVDQIQEDGSVKQISYANAFELDPDTEQIQLKKGINPEWAPYEVDHVIVQGDTIESIAKKYNMSADELKAKNKISDLSNFEPGDKLLISRSTEFMNFKLQLESVGKMLNGQMDQLTDAPQADKFLLYRLFTFYKKFATGMFLNRFQADMSKDNRWGHVYNWDLGTTTKGYYISAFQAMYKTVADLGAYYPLMTPKEKVAIKKVVTEMIGLMVMGFGLVFLFGYDKGDEDRFAKMRKREEDYGTLGWLSNHALYQLMTVKQENQAFVPILGFDEWVKYGDTTSIVFGPTLKLYLKIMNDIWYMTTGNKKGVYRADSGPYPWQKEDKYKLWNHLLSLYGIKGKTYDPIYAIKMTEAFQNLK